MNVQERLPQPENKLHYPALDGLRAIAVLLVFSSHYIFLPPALSWGFAGVDVFFVLSGFLITGILYDTQHRVGRYRIFYIRRSLRIFPLYYAVLLLPVLLYPLMRWELHPAQWLWPVYLGNYARFFWQGSVVGNTSVFEDLRSIRFPAFAYQIPHLWSLCVEEQFYLVWPFVVFLVGKRKRLRNLCLVMVVVILLLRVIALHVFSAQTIDLGLLYRTTPLRGDSLLLGGALAMCMRGPEGKRLVELARRLLWVLLAVSLVLEVACRVRSGHFFDPDYGKFHSSFLYTLLALFSGVVLMLAIDARTALYRFCLHPALRWLGVRSYGFYVYHLLLGSAWGWIAKEMAFGHRGTAGHLLPVIAFAGTLLVSYASFRFFEAPLLRLKDRYAK